MVLFSYIDLHLVLELIVRANPLLLFVYIALFTLALVVAAKRWLILLRSHGINLSYLEAVKIYWIGIYLSNFLPSSIGGDISRIGLLYRFNKTTQVASSVVVERFFGLISLLGFASCSAFLRPEVFDFMGGVIVYWSGLIVLVLGILVFLKFSQVLITKLRDRKTAQSKIANQLNRLLVAIDSYRGQKVFLRAIVLSSLFYLVGFIAHYCIAMALGIDISLLDVIMVAPLIFLISMIPVSVNAIGLAESAFVVCYSQVGMGKPQAIAFALLLRFVQMACSAVGGILLARYANNNLNVALNNLDLP